MKGEGLGEKRGREKEGRGKRKERKRSGEEEPERRQHPVTQALPLPLSSYPHPPSGRLLEEAPSDGATLSRLGKCQVSRG